MAEAAKEVELKSRRLSVMAQIKETGGPRPLNPPSDAGGAKKRPISMSISALPDALKDQIRNQAIGKKVGSSPSLVPPAQPAMKSSTSTGAIPSAGSAPERLPAIPLIFSEPKGKDAIVNISPSATVQDALNEANVQLGIKSFDKMVGFLKDHNVYLSPSRTLASYILRPNERITITKFSKEKKTFFLTVNLVDSSDKEVVECTPDHTAWGVIVMLTKRAVPGPAESFALMKDGQKVPPITKLSAAGIKGAVPVDVKKVAADPSEIPSPPELKVKKVSKEKEKEVKTRKMAASVSATMFQSSASTGGIGSNATMEGPITKEQKASALSGFLLNRPSKDDLVKKNIMSKVEAEAATAGVTPLKLEIFQQLCSFLEKHIELQGIFRISGGLQDVRALYLQFGGSGPLDMTSSQMDPHTATGALKLYLREQKDPLIPFSLYAEFLKAQRLRDPNAQLNAIRVAVAKLPEPNISIVKLLMDFLRRIAAQSTVNLMNPGNLGIVFGPTIMWDPDTTSLNFENTNVQSALVVSMITNYDAIFNGEASPAAPAVPAPEAPAHTPAPPASGPKKIPFALPPGGLLPKRSASMMVTKKSSMPDVGTPAPIAAPVPQIITPVLPPPPPPASDELVPPPSPTKASRSPRSLSSTDLSTSSPRPEPIALDVLRAPSPSPSPPVIEAPVEEDDDENANTVSIDSIFASLVEGTADRKENRSLARKALRNESDFVAHAESQSPKELTKIVMSLLKHITKQ